MELTLLKDIPENCKSLICAIRLLLLPNFLINKFELFKFIAMSPIYNRFRIQDEIFKDNYKEGFIMYGNVKYDLNLLIKYRKEDHNDEKQIYTTRFEDVINNYIQELTSNNYEFLLSMERMIFPMNDYVCKNIEVLAGKKLFPLNLNKILEFVPWDFISKYYDRLFGAHNFRQEINNDEMIIIQNTHNDVKCKIPKILFKLYCGFNSLTVDHPELNIFTIPILFNEYSSEFLVKCLKEGKIISFPVNMKEEDFLEFRHMISYLDIKQNV